VRSEISSSYVLYSDTVRKKGFRTGIWRNTRTCSETEYGDKRTEKGEQAKQAIKMTLASILTNFYSAEIGLDWGGGGRGERIIKQW